MIKEIRNYILEQAAKSDTDLSLIDDPFGNNDVSEVELDTGIKVIFGAVSTSPGANFFTRDIPVTVELYKKAFRDITEDYDELFDKAIEIEDNIIALSNIGPNLNFTGVTSSGITPEQVDTNDRIVRMIINLSFRRDCATE